MRLRTQLTAAVSIGMVLVLILALATFGVAVRMNKLSDEQDGMLAVRDRAFNLLALTQEFTTHSEARAQRQWKTNHAALLQLLDEASDKRTPIVPVPAELLAQARSLDAIFQQMVDAKASPIDFRDRQVELLVGQLTADVQSVSESSAQWAGALAAAHQQTQHEYYLWALSVPLLMLIMLSLIAALLMARVLRPLSTLQRAVHAVTQGDISLRCATGTNDEFGQLSHDFDVMAVDLVAKLRCEIADREHAQEVLRQSEERFRQMFENNASTLLLIEPDSGLIVDANAAAARFYGYSIERLRTMSIDQINALPASEIAAQRAPTIHQEPDCFVLSQRLATGDLRSVEVRSTPIRLGTGILLFSIVTDVTEREQAGQALVRSDRLLRDSQKAANIGSYVNDLDAGTFECTSTLDEIFGITKDYPHTNEGWVNFMHPDFMQTMHDALLESINHRKPFDAEYKIIRPSDGIERWMHGMGQIGHDDKGHAVSLIGTVQDITERKAAEEAQRIAATAFESQQGVIVTDTQHVILRVNKAFTRITGYTSEEAVGRTPRLLASGRHEPAFYAAMWESIKRTGQWQGEIWNRRKNGTVYPESLYLSAVRNEADVTTHYVGTFSDVTSARAAEVQIESLAFSDLLTGLPNRRMLLVQLQQAMIAGEREKRQGALLLVDLDNFKNLNDALGHEQGDLLLRQSAERLSACAGEGETVARLGGDEFVVLLKQLDQSPLNAAMHAETVGNRILDALSQPFQLDASEISCSASIGISLFGEREDTIEPLKRAELAMYEAKAHGRNALRFFDPRMQAVVNSRVALESRMREAIAARQFLLHYQPQVTDKDQITGVEALLRWPDPKRGMVSPSEFIPLAEETGLILPIGNWVLETACRQLALWANEPALAQLTVAVNVSLRQFHQRDFVDQVLSTLARTGANPSRLKIELTESLLVTDLEGVIEKMNALKGKGVTFSLDDFGTGYSSLSYLKRLPLDQLKIDQGFVRDILIDRDDAAIARMVTVLAASMGLEVIAEGVETQAQRDFLDALGCHHYQGYLFSRPLPIQEFETLLKRT